MSNTPAYRQKWILEELKKDPLIINKRMFGKYIEEFGNFSEPTFTKDWKIAKKQHEIYQKKVNEEKERISIEMEVEAVKQGLKTKFERLMILQGQIDKIERELLLGECDEVKIIKGEPKKIKRPLLPFEKSAMRKNIKEIQSEISKIEGDYSPTQTEVDIRQITGMIIK